MAPVIALWLTLLAPQTSTPVTPQTTQIPASQAAQPPSPDLYVKQQAAPRSGPRPNPDDAGKYHIGDGVTAPWVKHKVDPKFPDEARKSRIAGITLVNLMVGTDGVPFNVNVVRSLAEKVEKSQRAAALLLDQAAVEAVKKYRFSPATFQGHAVPIELNVEVNFQVF